MDKLILTDGTIIDLEAGASMTAIQVKSANRTVMAKTWGKLTQENLKSVQIKNDSDLTVGTYTDLVLVSEVSTVAADGSVITSYRFREKTEGELRLDALEERLNAAGGSKG